MSKAGANRARRKTVTQVAKVGVPATPVFAMPPPFVCTAAAARFLSLSRSTLNKYRSSGTGPKYSKIGGRVLYAISDLQAWVESAARGSTSDRGQGAVLPDKPVDPLGLKLAEGLR